MWQTAYGVTDSCAFRKHSLSEVLEQNLVVLGGWSAIPFAGPPARLPPHILEEGEERRKYSVLMKTFVCAKTEICTVHTCK